MHPLSSEGIRNDMHDTTSESGHSSDRSEASRSARQPLQHAPDVQSSSSSSSTAVASPLPQINLAPSLRKATDESENRGPSGANDARRPNTERRKRSSPDSPHETVTHLKPLCECDTEEDFESPPQQEEWDTHDADFETSLISRRNRRVLLTRLYETAPRGRLSLVSICTRKKFHCYEYWRPRSYDIYFLFPLCSLISHEEESAWKMPSC
jgi:hypothetical protein